MDGIVCYLNGDRGLHAVRAIAKAGHGVVALVFDEASWKRDDFQALAASVGAQTVATSDVNASAFRDQLRALSPELGVICGFPTIFRRSIIELPRLGTINLHGGRLPQYRGGSPLNWQIIAGEEKVGISVLRVDEGIDSGEVLAQTEFPLSPTETIRHAHERANQYFESLVVDAIELVESGGGGSAGVRQDETLAAYWHQRNDADGWIDWHRLDAFEVRNLVRGTSRPYPGAFSFIGGRKVRVFGAEISEVEIRGVPGRILHLLGYGPLVICHAGAVRLTEYEADDGDPIKLKTGHRFDP